MAELKTDDSNIPQDTPPVNESESDTLSDDEREIQSFQSESGGEEEQSEQSGDDSLGSEESQTQPQEQQTQEGKKPSRVERRIQSLVDKIKQNNTPENPVPTGENVPQIPRIQSPSQNEDEPLITPQELEEGSVDPVELQKRIDQRISREVQKGIQEAQQTQERDRQLKEVNSQFESALKEHESDLAEVSQNIDPALEQFAIREYELLNHAINPITGQKQFIPAVKMSEIVQKLNTVGSKVAESMSQRNQQYARRVSQTSAIPSGGSLTNSKKVTGDTNNFAEFEKAYT